MTRKIDKLIRERFERLLNMKFSDVFSLVEFSWALADPCEDEYITDNSFLLSNRNMIERKLKNFRIISSFEAFGIKTEKEKEIMAA